MDPDRRLYQTGVGTIHPQPQTNALDWYANGCVNGAVAELVRDNETNKESRNEALCSSQKLHVDRVFKKSNC
jgi:hypothetical protein